MIYDTLGTIPIKLWLWPFVLRNEIIYQSFTGHSILKLDSKVLALLPEYKVGESDGEKINFIPLNYW